MFNGCESLSTLDLKNFNTTNVKDMNHMFYGCNSLSVVDLTNFNTEKVTNNIQMFYNCNSLSSFYSSKIKPVKFFPILRLRF